jgi:hypothetical protein
VGFGEVYRNWENALGGCGFVTVSRYVVVCVVELPVPMIVIGYVPAGDDVPIGGTLHTSPNPAGSTDVIAEPPRREWQHPRGAIAAPGAEPRSST